MITSVVRLYDCIVKYVTYKGINRDDPNVLFEKLGGLQDCREREKCETNAIEFGYVVLKMRANLFGLLQ